MAIYVKEAGEGRWIMGHDELEVTVTTQNIVGTLLKKTIEVSKVMFRDCTRKLVNQEQCLPIFIPAHPDFAI